MGEAQRVVGVGAVLAGEARRARTAARPSGGRPGRRSPTALCAPSACGVTPMWSSPRQARRLRARRGRSSRPTRRSSSSRSASGPIAVDEELQPGLAARLAVLLGVAEDRGDAGDDLGGLLGRDEDVEPAREARAAREAAADAQVEARACRRRGSRAGERDVVDQPARAVLAAAGDRDLVLARQVRVELVVEEVLVDRLGRGVAVDDLVVGDAGQRCSRRRCG